MITYRIQKVRVCSTLKDIVFSDGNVHSDNVKLLSLSFSHYPNVTVPTANTCSLTICLPTVITDAAIVASRMTYGIFNSVVFGLT